MITCGFLVCTVQGVCLGAMGAQSVALPDGTSVWGTTWGPGGGGGGALDDKGRAR